MYLFQPSHEYSKATAKARLAQLDGYKVETKGHGGHSRKPRKRYLKLIVKPWLLLLFKKSWNLIQGTLMDTDTMEEAGDMVTTRPIMYIFTLHCPSPEGQKEKRSEISWHNITFLCVQVNFGVKQKRVDVFKALHFYLHLLILPALKFPITTFTTNQKHKSPIYM